MTRISVLSKGMQNVGFSLKNTAKLLPMFGTSLEWIGQFWVWGYPLTPGFEWLLLCFLGAAVHRVFAAKRSQNFGTGFEVIPDLWGTSANQINCYGHHTHTIIPPTYFFHIATQKVSFKPIFCKRMALCSFSSGKASADTCALAGFLLETVIFIYYYINILPFIQGTQGGLPTSPLPHFSLKATLLLEGDSDKSKVTQWSSWLSGDLHPGLLVQHSFHKTWLTYALDPSALLFRTYSLGSIQILPILGSLWKMYMIVKLHKH